MKNKKYKYIKVDSSEHIFLRAQSDRLLKEFNAIDDLKRKREILEELFGSVGENVTIGANFYCDTGKNISIGKDVIVGPNSIFIDNEKIKIGSCVMLAPNVQLYTAYHPILPEERYILDKKENDPIYFNTCADPIEIKDGAWIGGGVIILPNVTIGKNSIIGAGSVVSRSIPDNCVALGNPCRVTKYFEDIRKAK